MRDHTDRHETAQRHSRRTVGFYASLCLLSLSCSGCEEEQIHTYVAPKAQSISPRAETPTTPAEPTRMLAAILNQGENAWFFKLTSSPQQAAELREEFGQFVASTSFESGRPSWEIPDHWTEQPGNQIRFATFQVGENGPEISVTKLPGSEDEVSAAVANINRWRGQLGLSNLETEQYLQALGSDDDAEILPEEEGEIVSISTPAGQAILIDFVGEMSSGNMPPFARMGARPTPPRSTPPSSSTAGGAQFSPPDHWQQGELTAMRKASYRVGEGEDVAEITVIPLSSNSGSLLDNVNRWRGQVELPAWSEEELAQNNQNLIGQGFRADYVQLFGSEEAILGAIINRGEQNWFIKLKGPTSLVKQEVASFEEFVKTIEF